MKIFNNVNQLGKTENGISILYKFCVWMFPVPVQCDGEIPWEPCHKLSFACQSMCLSKHVAYVI